MYLFIYSKIIYSGKYTSSNDYALFHLQNEGEFHGVIIGKFDFRSVEIGKVSPLCCTVIFVIDGVKCNTSIIQRS